MSIRVLIVDDHRLFADSLRALLMGEPGIEAIPPVHSAEEAIEWEMRDPVDVVVMDVDLPGADGIEGTRRIRRIDPEARIIVISALNDHDVIGEALAAGANGFISKTRAADDLVDAIKRVVAGELVIPSGELAPAVARIEERRENLRKRGQLLARLTPREVEILQAMARGASTSTIASQLGIGPLTVRGHVRSLLSKLGAHSRLEAVAHARGAGLIRTAERDGADVEPGR